MSTMSDRDAISQAIATALTTASPAAAKYLLRGAELKAEQAASERLHRWLTIGGLAVLAVCVVILLRELAG